MYNKDEQEHVFWFTIWYPRPYLPYEVFWAFFDDFTLWPVCPLGPNNFENIEFLRSVLESLGSKNNICEIKNHNILLYHSRKCNKSYQVHWSISLRQTCNVVEFCMVIHTNLDFEKKFSRNVISHQCDHDYHQGHHDHQCLNDHQYLHDHSLS